MKSYSVRISGVAGIIILCLIIITSVMMGGCKKEVPEEEILEETIEEEIEETPEETGEEPAGTGEGEEDESGIMQMEITGNINILSGLEISDTVSDNRPLAAMIENSPDSRPQSGLINADIVFEVVDEGGVTRYVAVFSSYNAEVIGPVRSARPYYAEIARSFDPVYAFWGTFPEAYKIIENLGLDYLTAVGDSSGNSSIVANAPHWRDNSRSTVTEHTGFMSTIQLREKAGELGYETKGGQSPLRFKIDALESDRGTIANVNIDFSHPEYSVDFTYDPGENIYLKSTGGSPHMDYESGEQLSVNNIIIMITNIDGPIDQYGHMVVRTTGSSDAGKAYFFMDGNVLEGTWERSSVFDPFTYKDMDGNPVLFNRGKTWVAMVQGIDRLNY
ncbi:MAG: DUF3048 domain-containing protein [Actinobacteria bacterium]|nr:DUF3048 domain-containing protein [Actinomycetota bacterium]